MKYQENLKMKGMYKTPFILLLALTSLVACDKKNSIPDTSETYKVNKFIHEAMTDAYFWYDAMPGIDFEKETDSKAYFHKLLTEDDRAYKWSSITDDVNAVLAAFEGEEKGYGWTLGKSTLPESENLIAIVLHVSPGSPAAKMGLKRGDVILYINNSPIDETNYESLFTSDQITITLGVDNGNGLVPGASAGLSAEALSSSPVVTTSVIEHNNHKIGYLLYSHFDHAYKESLDSALLNMAQSGITNLVVDLRYNKGGDKFAAQHLCSAIAPLSYVEEEAKLANMIWNRKYQKYLVDNQIMSEIEIRFDKTINVKLGLDKVWIITGTETAAVSELVISALNLYMDVTTIGSTTKGHYTGSIMIRPMDMYEDSPEYYQSFNNWGIQPVVFRYANAAGLTDFYGGFVPNLEVDEIYSSPLGHLNEPLLRATIEDITGTSTIMKSAATETSQYKITEITSSRFESYKQNLPLRACY